MSGLPEVLGLSEALYYMAEREGPEDPVLRIAALCGALARTMLEFDREDHDRILADVARNQANMVRTMRDRGVGGHERAH